MTDAVFVRRALVVVALAGLAALATWLVVVGIDVLLLVFAGVLVALFLRGVAHVVQRHVPLGETASVTAVVLILVALAGAGAWLLAPRLGEQVSQLIEQIPQAITNLQEQLRSSTWGRVVLSHSPDAASLARRFLLGQAGGTLAAALGSLVGGTVNLAVVLFVALYVALAPGPYRRGVLWLVPPARRGQTRSVLDRLATVLQRWLVGKAVAMLIIGALTSLGLTLVGVPAALALGALAGLLNFVPYVGPVLGFLPAALLALTQSTTMFGWVLGLYVVIQGLESYVVTPLIQQEAVALPPALILTAQVLLGVAFGWLGVLLATPLTACVVVLIDQLYVERPRADGARERDVAA